MAAYDLVIVGTAMAHIRPEEAALARAMIDANPRTVVVALRTPWDISAFPRARTYVCSYGVLAPTIEALVAALFGDIPFQGHLSVELAGLHGRGHGLTSRA